LGIFVGILAVLLNLTLCSLLLYTEKRLAVQGKISPRGEILYFWDYNYFRWGNLLLLSIMDFAIAFVLVERWPLPLWAVVLCLLAGLVWTFWWHKRWVRRTKGFDSVYGPQGMSSLGILFLSYFWGQYALGFVGGAMVILMVMNSKEWSFMAIPGLIAATLYFVALYSDARAGRTP